MYSRNEFSTTQSELKLINAAANNGITKPQNASGIVFAEVVQSVKVNNLTYMSQSLAKEIIDIKPGDTLSPEKVDNAVLALYKQGYFSDIYATFDNGVLQFFVKEKPAVASIELKGYGTQSEKETIY